MPSDDVNDLSLVPSEMEQIAQTKGNLSCKYRTCTDPADKVCPVCHQPFCAKHASRVDPEFCSDDLKESDTEIKQDPLVDDEGVTHAGTLMTPTGPAYKSLMQRIAEMTEDQLAMHIQHYKTLVKEAERVLDYRRIALSAAELQLGDLQAMNRRKRSAGYKPKGTGVAFSASSTTPTQKASEAKVKKVAEIAKNLGLPPDKMKEFLIALAAAKKDKK